MISANLTIKTNNLNKLQITQPAKRQISAKIGVANYSHLLIKLANSSRGEKFSCTKLLYFPQMFLNLFI